MIQATQTYWNEYWNKRIRNLLVHGNSVLPLITLQG